MVAAAALKSFLRFAGIGLAVVLGVLLLTLALPVRSWRTGEQPRPRLVMLPTDSTPELHTRIWIDTDAACGEGRRTDPDDCLALLALARDSTVRIAGISTVHGNAAIDRTTAVTRALIEVIDWRERHVPAVYRGASGPTDSGERPLSVERALAEALREGPLTIVALGPLTNIAATLESRPELTHEVTSIIAVMGRRTGHLFHPGEGRGGGILFGHGPVFRDFNVAQDPDAVTTILRLGLPLTLVPYEVAREIEVGSAELLDLEQRSEAAAWVARTMFNPLHRSTSLLVTQDPSEIEEPLAAGEARYCPESRDGLRDHVLRVLYAAMR
jgi:purine nucleosidase